MAFNDRQKAAWPRNDLQSKVLSKLAPSYTADELASILGFDSHKDARNAIDGLRKLAFNIENDRETNTFRFHPVPRSS